MTFLKRVRKVDFFNKRHTGSTYQSSRIKRGTGMLSTRKLKHERADEGAGVRVRL